MTANNLMTLAIQEADMHHTPYGCVIYNRVTSEYIKAANQTRSKGKTAHAEIECLRLLNEKEWSPADLVLYTTAEPCPMCLSAIIWCRINEVVYGVPISDIKKYHRQIDITSQTVVDNSWSNCKIEGGFMKESCLDLFEKHS